MPEPIELEVSGKSIQRTLAALLKDLRGFASDVQLTIGGIKTGKSLDELALASKRATQEGEKLVAEFRSLASQDPANEALKKIGKSVSSLGNELKLTGSLADKWADSFRTGGTKAAGSVADAARKIAEAERKGAQLRSQVAGESAAQIAQIYSSAAQRELVALQAAVARKAVIDKKGASLKIDILTRLLGQEERLINQGVRTAVSAAEAEAKAVAAAKRHGAYEQAQISRIALAQERGDQNRQTAELRAQLALKNRILGNFAGSVAQVGKSLFSALALPATVGAGLSLVIRQLAEYDLKITQAAIATGNAEAAIGKFRAAATKAASETFFTTTQAAEGLVTLSRAGFSAAQATEALVPTLNLATTAGTDLATAADVMSTTIRSFNLEATDAASVADTLAAAANSSNTDVRGLAEALKYAAPAAKAAGFSLNETAAIVGVLSDNGIKGSLAGTSLRAVITGLVDPSEKAKKAIYGMGLGLADVDVQTRGVLPVLETLAERQIGVVEAFQLFGKRGAPGLLALTNNIDRLKLLNLIIQLQKGYAEDNARVINESLGGALKSLPARVSAGIAALGERGLSKALRDVLRLTTVVGEALKFALPSGINTISKVISFVVYEIVQVSEIATRAIAGISEKLSEFARFARLNEIADGLAGLSHRFRESSAAIQAEADAVAASLADLDGPSVTPNLNWIDAMRERLSFLSDEVEEDVAPRFEVDIPRAMGAASAAADRTSKATDGLKKKLDELKKAQASALSSEQKITEERDKLVARREELIKKSILEIEEVNEQATIGIDIDRLESQVKDAAAIRERADRAVSDGERALLLQAAAAKDASGEISSLGDAIGSGTSQFAPYITEAERATSAILNLRDAASGKVPTRSVGPSISDVEGAFAGDPEAVARLNNGISRSDQKPRAAERGQSTLEGGQSPLRVLQDLFRKSQDEKSTPSPTRSAVEEIQRLISEGLERRDDLRNRVNVPGGAQRTGGATTGGGRDLIGALDGLGLLDDERIKSLIDRGLLGGGRIGGGATAVGQQTATGPGRIGNSFLDILDSLDSVGLLGSGGVVGKGQSGPTAPPLGADELQSQRELARAIVEEILSSGIAGDLSQSVPQSGAGQIDRIDSKTSEIRRPGDRLGPLPEAVAPVVLKSEGDTATEVEIKSISDELERARLEAEKTQNSLADIADPLKKGEIADLIGFMGESLDGSATSAEKLSEAQGKLNKYTDAYSEGLTVTNKGLGKLTEEQQKALYAGEALLRNTDANASALEGLRSRSGGVAYEFGRASIASDGLAASQDSVAQSTEAASTAASSSQIVYDEVTKTWTNVAKAASDVASETDKAAKSTDGAAEAIGKFDETVGKAEARVESLTRAVDGLGAKLIDTFTNTTVLRAIEALGSLIGDDE